MKKTAPFVFISMLLLSGCGMTYFLEGAKYDNKESFVAARAAMNTRCTESISAIPVPLVKRKLIAMIPTQEAIYKNRYSIIKAASPNDPVTMDKLRDNPIFSAINENYRLIVERIKRKNIYPSVEVVEYETLSTPQASANADILHIAMAEALGGKDIFYLTTQKSGKQIVSIDAASPKCEAIRDSYLSSIQTLALQ
ncbi:MAG: hypothetical protein K8H75_01370 [Sulfuricella sp.]|nr:hypothetical protein [Sulfuricella sp.]